ncbi:MAG TPA: hypothetical protein VIK11_07785 [Tepidiformaceae bacterium]
MITLLSDSGKELATGMLKAGRADRTLELDRVIRGKGQLLHYFFGRGRRAVLVEVGDFRLRGVLATRWIGSERLWQVALEVPRPVRSPIATTTDPSGPHQPRS